MNKVRDCLVDTCIWSRWFDPKTRPEIEAWLTNISGDRKLYVSVVTWGEIEYGYKVQEDKQKSKEVEFRGFLDEKGPSTLDIDKHVVEPYGRLRAALFEKYGKSNKWPEELKDPTTAKELGIQENDLWIASQAISRNLILLTEDKMYHLREVAGEELHVELWKGRK
jgi:tRNA(fMet)-specific endonuclease VapC